MELFWGIFFSFPVVIFSALLTLCVMYWLTAAIGILSVDCLDIAINVEDTATDIPSSGFGGLLLKFGFNEVPLTLVITLISLFGWSISYFSFRFFILPLYNDILLYFIIGAVFFVISLITAIYLTAFVIKPIRPIFTKLNLTHDHKSLLGQIVLIRSSIVNNIKGEAIYEDGGAGLILQVRSDEAYQFKRGDKAVLLRYDMANNFYEIISIEEFNG
jgi:hypothetical protein